MRLALFPFLLAGLLGGAACSDDGPVVPWPENFEALEPIVADRIREAADKVLENPGDLRSWSELGMVYQANRLLRPAMEVYDQANADSPDAKNYYRRALCQLEIGATDGALRDLEQAVSLSPGAAVPLWRTGSILLEQGEIEAARSSFQQAIENNEGFLPARLGAVRVHLLLDENDAALALLERVLEEAPRNRHALDLERTARRQAGMPEREEIRFRSKSFEPQAYDPWEDEVLAFRAETRLARAIRLLARDKAERAAPLLEAERDEGRRDIMIFGNLAEAYGALGRVEDERKALRGALALAPDNVRFLLSLADLDEEQRNFDDALAGLDHAARVAPDRAEVYRKRSRLFGKMSRSNEAVEAMREALRLDGRDPRLWAKLGFWEMNLGNHEAALEAFEEAVRFPEPPARTLAGLALARAHNGFYEEARSAFAQAAGHPRLKPQELEEARAELDILLLSEKGGS